MPQAYMPSVDADVLPDAGPFVVPAGVVPPPRKASIWNQPVMQAWAREYPFPDIAELAVQATGEGVMPFVGIMAKSVLPGRTPLMSEEVALLCREQFELCCLSLTVVQRGVERGGPGRDWWR